MRLMLETLDRRSKEFVKHPLFAYMRESSIAPEQRLAFVPQMAHFVMTFADLYTLVLRSEPAQDKFQELVNAHTYEDGGHWKWYLHDLEKMGDPRIPFSESLRFVWGDATKNMRLLAYHMCRLGFGADSLTKLALVHCIEASGSIMLEHAAVIGKAYQEQTGKKLVYFGPHHFDSESNHTLEQDSVEDDLKDTVLEPAVSQRLSAIVDECFDLFTACVDEILAYAKSGHHLGHADPQRF